MNRWLNVFESFICSFLHLYNLTAFGSPWSSDDYMAHAGHKSKLAHTNQTGPELFFPSRGALLLAQLACLKPTICSWVGSCSGGSIGPDIIGIQEAPPHTSAKLAQMWDRTSSWSSHTGWDLGLHCSDGWALEPPSPLTSPHGMTVGGYSKLREGNLLMFLHSELHYLFFFSLSIRTSKKVDFKNLRSNRCFWQTSLSRTTEPTLVGLNTNYLVSRESGSSLNL